MKKSYEEFLGFVKGQCKEHGVTIKLSRGNYVKCGIFKCGGYFDSEPEPELVAAMGHKDFKSLLVHEYCHMTQWLDEIPLWDKASESLTIVDLWLRGEDLPDIKKHLGVCRDLELDNEKRAIKFVKEYDLGITPIQYTKKANAYILFYNWILETRKWSQPGNAPYSNDGIVKLMSGKFDMNYKTLEPKIHRAFTKAGI